MSKIFLLCLWVAGSVSALEEMDKILKISLQYQVLQTPQRPGGVSAFDKAAFYLGYNSDSQQPLGISFRPDLNYGGIIMNQFNQSSPQGWGVPCSSTLNATINCNITYPVDKMDTYKANPYTYQRGSSFFLFNSQRFNVAKYTPMSFNLAQNLTYDNWDLGKTGVAGLGPQSSIWPYLFGLFAFKENKFVFNFNYQVGDQKDKWQAANPSAFSSDSNIALNGYDPDLVTEQGIYYTSQPSTPDFANSWTLSTVKVTVNGINLISGPACLTNVEHAFFAGRKSYEDVNKIICNAFCGNSDCSNCKLNSQTNSLVFSITLQDNDVVNYNMSANDFLYLNGDQVKVSYDDLAKWETSGCTPGHSIGLGRLFFLKALIVFEVNKKSDDRRIGLGQYQNIPRASETDKVILSSFILTCTLVLLGVALKKCTEHRAASGKDNSGEVSDYTSVEGKHN
jgi:hypothetical protein